MRHGRHTAVVQVTKDQQGAVRHTEHAIAPSDVALIMRTWLRSSGARAGSAVKYYRRTPATDEGDAVAS